MYSTRFKSGPTGLAEAMSRVSSSDTGNGMERSTRPVAAGVPSTAMVRLPGCYRSSKVTLASLSLNLNGDVYSFRATEPPLSMPTSNGVPLLLLVDELDLVLAGGERLRRPDGVVVLAQAKP